MQLTVNCLQPGANVSNHTQFYVTAFLGAESFVYLPLFLYTIVGVGLFLIFDNTL